MSLLDDFKVRFQNDEKLDLPAIEDDWDSLDPQYKCYYGGVYGTDECTDEAIYNLIAHLWLAENNDSTSPIKDEASKSWGSESITYTQTDETSGMYSFFNSSIYGQRYLRIISPNRGGYFV